MNRKGSTGGLAFLFLLVILLGVSLYFLYFNLPVEPVDLIFSDLPDNNPRIEYSQSKQFYENMRFQSNRISYKIEDRCGSKKLSGVEEAFSIIAAKTILDFYPDDEKAEITVFCSQIAPEAERKGYFVAGEGGPTEVINNSIYGVILSAKVSFFREEKCDSPTIALHEILHALGFDHNNNPSSIMFPTLDCDQTLDDSIVADINRLYSVSSAPDLRFSEVDASKGGRYLNFDIKVINQGLKSADDVSLHVFADDKLVREFDLQRVDIGVSKTLEVDNLKTSRSAHEITFIIDYRDEIDEIFENNNKATLVLPED